MYKIIGGDHNEYGPVTADELTQWIAEGRLNGQSLVRLEGSTQWQPLASFPEFEAALAAQVRHDDAIPPSPPPALDPLAWCAQIANRPPELSIGGCLSRSWSLLAGNAGLLWGAVALVWLVGTACEQLPFGSQAYGLLRGVFFGGLYLVFLKRIRGEPTSASEAFSGFRIRFAQLFLAGLVSALLTGVGLLCCLVVPGIYLLVAWVFAVPLVADKGIEFWTAMELSRKVATRVWFQLFALLLLAFLPSVVVTVYVQSQVANLLMPFFHELFSGGAANPEHLTQMASDLKPQLEHFARSQGLLVRLVLLLNLPFGLGALMYAYEALFGPRPPRPS
jgi:hypothetical protein